MERQIVIDYLVALNDLSHLHDYMDEFYKNDENLKKYKNHTIVKISFNQINETITQIGENQTVGQNIHLVFVDKDQKLLWVWFL